ncbi:MAG: hypothetical protein ABIO06_01850 [Pseudolysinimonas sp.]
MTDATPLPEQPDLVQQFTDRLAEVDGMPLKTPFYANPRQLYARIDRLEAKAAVLADYSGYLLQRIDALEARLPAISSPTGSPGDGAGTGGR